MTKIAVTLVAVALSLQARSAPGAALDQLEQRVGKYAAPSGSTQVKGVCVCQDGGERHGRAGVITWGTGQALGWMYDEVRVGCTVSTYDLAGGQQSSAVCLVFTKLAK
jgi:hypothetical protein